MPPRYAIRVQWGRPAALSIFATSSCVLFARSPEKSSRALLSLVELLTCTVYCIGS